jgi:hypothetical protein
MAVMVLISRPVAVNKTVWRRELLVYNDFGIVSRVVLRAHSRRDVIDQTDLHLDHIQRQTETNGFDVLPDEFASVYRKVGGQLVKLFEKEK